VFTRELGIDLGACNTLVYLKNKGIVMREPSVAAVNVSTNEIVAIGERAREMIANVPGSLVAVKPFKNDGSISDLNIITSIIKYFIQKNAKSSFFVFKPKLTISISSGATEVERHVLEEAAYQAEAGFVTLVKKPMAAALGENVPINDLKGHLIINIGGGTTEIAVIFSGNIIAARSLQVAGNKFDEDIINYIKKKYNLLIGKRTAENIKKEIGSAHFYKNEGTMEIKGRNLINGLPEHNIISALEVREALYESFTSIIRAVKSTLKNTPSELLADIKLEGIILTGGSAFLKGINRLFSEEIGVPVKIAENPLECVALGTGMFLKYKK